MNRASLLLLCTCLAACESQGQAVHNTMDNMKQLSRTANNMQKAADTIVAGINKLDRTVRRYTETAPPPRRDTSHVTRPAATREQQVHIFDSLFTDVMK